MFIFFFSDSSSCSLDYTPVNAHIYSFVLLTWICTLLFPLLLMLFFYMRQLIAGTFNGIISSSTTDDSVDVRVLGLASFGTVLCYVPHYVANLCAGLGYAVPYYAHTAATFLLYASFSLVFVIAVLCCSCSTVDSATNGCCCWTCILPNLFSGCVSCCCVSNTGNSTTTSAYSPCRQRLLQVRTKNSNGSQDKRSGTKYGCIHVSLQQIHSSSSKDVNETML